MNRACLIKTDTTGIFQGRVVRIVIHRVKYCFKEKHTLAPEARCLKDKTEQITALAVVQRRETGSYFFSFDASRLLSLSREKITSGTGKILEEIKKEDKGIKGDKPSWA